MSGNKYNRELMAMKISFVLSILYVVTDIAVAIICDSETILLDGLYGVADIVVSLMAIFVISRINNPPNEKYHFGYAKFEPFMTALEGVLITSICISTVFLSIQDIAHPEPVAHPNLIIWYSFVNIFVGIGFGLYARYIGKKTGSQIVNTDSELWTIGGFISVAVFIAFFISKFMTNLGFKWYADYVDPVMAILLSLFFLQRPVAILKESFFDLVDASPQKEIRAEVDKVIDQCVKKYFLKGVKWLKLRKAGRKVFIFVCFFMDPDKTLGEAALLKDEIVAEVRKFSPYYEILVFFEKA